MPTQIKSKEDLRNEFKKETGSTFIYPRNYFEWLEKKLLVNYTQFSPPIDVEEKEGAILGWKTEQDFELKEAKERIHELKTWSEHFNQVFMGHKTFEVRLNDRDFKVGDTLTLIEGDLWGDYPEGKRWFPTGRKLSRRITHILHGGQFGIREGYCVMSIQ